jgi:transcription initiation factor IIE alpha subunit
MPSKEIRRGFPVVCIRCGERETLSLSLDNATSFTCSDCDGEFTASDVRDVINEWGPVLSWIDSAPEFQRRAATA